MTHALTYRGPSLTALHEEYAKAHRIDEHAPLAGRRQIVVDTPVDRVWRTLTDVLAWDTNLEPGEGYPARERGNRRFEVRPIQQGRADDRPIRGGEA